MTEVVDFFFSPHPTAQERRLRAALQDGLAHCSRILPHDPAPGEDVTLLFSTNTDKPIERVAVYYTTDGTEPIGQRGDSINSLVVLAEPGETTYDNKLGFLILQWRAVLPGQADGTLVRYRADGWSINDPLRHWYADSVDPINAPLADGHLFAYHVDRWQAPAWLADAVIYQIFVDRFSSARDEPPLHDPGNITSFFGGTLGGVLEKLDYIQQLGANCIWLSPIFESPTHHGYNPSDYHNVAQRYGTNESLRCLIREAHQRGMQVLLDFVANHTSDEHPSFLAARSNPASSTARWYSFGNWPPHGYRSYASVRTMPELVTEHPAVQHYLNEAALHWLGYFGADGLRLDYVPGPPHAFWTLFQREIKQHFPQALTLGEITSPPAELVNYAGRVDAYMDFSLARMLRRVFALRQAPLKELLTFLDERASQLPAPTPLAMLAPLRSATTNAPIPTMGRATLLDNHDMHRFLWLAGGNRTRLKLAAVCQMTLAGAPIIYYGTEVGLSQADDAHKENAYARAPMIWGERQDHTLLEHYRQIIALRQAHPTLRHGRYVTLAVERLGTSTEDDRQAGAYLRICTPDECQHNTYLLIVLNNSEQPVRIRIPLLEQLASTGIQVDAPLALCDLLALTNTQVVNGQVELELPALGAAILEPRIQ